MKMSPASVQASAKSAFSRQKAIAGMDRVGAACGGPLRRSVDVEIALRGRRRAEPHGFIGRAAHAARRGRHRSRRRRCGCPCARAVRMTRQAISPRLAIRIFQNAATGFVRSSEPMRLAFIEKGGDAFLALLAGADRGDAAGGFVQHVGNDRLARDIVIRRLAAIWALGPPRRMESVVCSRVRAKASGTTTSWTRPSRCASAAVESFRREEIAPGLPLADGGNDIGADHGGDQGRA